MPAGVQAQGIQAQETAGMTGGSLPAQEMAGVQSQQTAVMSSGASSLPAEGSFELADPMLASVSSAGTGPAYGPGTFPGPVYSCHPISGKPVCEVDFSDL